MSSSRFSCPCCGTLITRAATARGKTVACPRCRTRVRALDRAAAAGTQPPVQRSVTWGLAGAATVFLLGVGFMWAVLPETEAELSSSAAPHASQESSVVQATTRPEAAKVAEPTATPALPSPEQVAVAVKAPEKKDVPPAKPNVAPASVAPPQVATRPVPSAPPTPRPRAYQDWLQDFEQAKQQAGRERKDVLLLFNGSDWCGRSVRLASEVLAQPTFQREADKRFVLVNLDFPRGATAKSKVQDADRNERLKKQFRIKGFPQIVLTDAQGRAFGFAGYQAGGPGPFLKHIQEQINVRVRRDQLVAAIAAQQSLAQLAAAREALDHLKKFELVAYHAPLLEEWNRLAEVHDPRNEHGYAEQFFSTHWLTQLSQFDEQPDTRDLVRLAGQLEAWKQQHHFKDPNLAGQLHAMAGMLFLLAGKHDQAAASFKAGLAFQPTDPEVLARLKEGVAGFRLSSGTGFVVGTGGYLLTNSHVVEGPGRVMVRLPRVKEPVPAVVVAQDEDRDMALLRVTLPRGIVLPPLRVAGRRVVNRGESVAALGFPLGDSVGSGLKLTTGVVSGLPEPGTDNMLLLDARINPGNSGGPLCDAIGNVIGMVTAKSVGERGVESYGMALPARDLEQFLAKHLPGYKPIPVAPGRRGSWEQVDRRVSPSVVMVLKLL